MTEDFIQNVQFDLFSVELVVEDTATLSLTEDFIQNVQFDLFSVELIIGETATLMLAENYVTIREVFVDGVKVEPNESKQIFLASDLWEIGEDDILQPKEGRTFTIKKANEVDSETGSTNKYLNEQGDFTTPIISHSDLTNKNAEPSFQHVDTTTIKETLVEADKVAILDSVSGKVVFTDKANIKARYLQNVTANTFVADATYEDFPFKCEIAITGVTSANNAEITFSLAQATSGDLAPICVTETNKIIIYAKSDLGTIIIPLIKVEVVL